MSPRKADVDLPALTDLVGRVFSPYDRCTIERTASGVSTQVYRIRRDDQTYYLRVAEERAASLAPEVSVLGTLRALGVKVPAVVHFEPFDDRLERSVMVTTEIPGEPLGHSPVGAATPEVVQAAGRDLAVMNSLPVKGFGWIRRDGADPVATVEAEHESFRSFALEHFDDDLALLEREVFTTAETTAISRTIDRFDAWLEMEQACLAHGDFDVTHIYQHEGRYTGIIDFGEIRGAEPLYDLGHFNLHDGETLPGSLLPFLLVGYNDVTPLPTDGVQRIGLSSVLIGVRALARNVRRQPPNAYQRHLVTAIQRCIGLLNT